MKLNLKSPLAIFDLETTGTNVSSDRIVEISIFKVLPDGSEEIKTMRIKPGIPISHESSMIHGIYDKDVADAPLFSQVAPTLDKFLEGCDLGGFNVMKFDIPLLIEEFLRADIEFDISKRKLVDAQKIFFLMEKRTLTAAYKFYCNKELKGAHGAEADTRATYEVIKSQIERYDGQSVEDARGNQMGVVENNINALHKISFGKTVDLASRIVLNDNNEEVFNFGKFKGKPVEEVLKSEKGYYDWMMKGDFPIDTKKKLTEIKLRGFNAR